MGTKKYSSAIWPVNEATTNIAFSWLLQLRWGAVLCQAILILIAYSFLNIALPLLFVSIIILFEITSNLLFTFLAGRKKVIPEWLFGLVMFLDIILLTALLYFTGGPMNPFTLLYLVHITIGAILMRVNWSWGLTVFTILCYSSFFIVDPEIIGQLPFMLPGGFVGGPEIQPACYSAIEEYTLLSDHMKLHLKGMLVAFVITAFFIVFFIGRIQKALEEHQLTLVSLEKERARSEKLSSLAALSAGAAHEFSTPLSTIAVAAGEMLHQLKRGKIDQGLLDDARLIKEQVKDCKEILYQMTADAGEHLGEALENYETDTVFLKILKEFPEADRARIRQNNQAAGISVRVPIRTLVRTVKGLINNGLDASVESSPVFLRCFYDEKFLYFEVVDQGCGMDEESAARAREPFYTTKEPGEGLGLGLFLAQNLAEQFGGELDIVSKKGGGTSVTLSLALGQIGLDR